MVFGIVTYKTYQTNFPGTFIASTEIDEHHRMKQVKTRSNTLNAAFQVKQDQRL